MTPTDPKEKARELLRKYYKLEMFYNTAKQAAIICVDEILELPFEYLDERKYYEQVREELGKL